ncbi:MAG: hypothetical protein FD145_11 [Candidatus Saganbacteria bacterium]|uniref:DUF362 domain-containing protein n=1 Tax=Candidatus Saganbacteria bacterium TaxID=2575572 RepID=A0A833L2D0_UNCSA|nr:MAG: hypothetical protein FD145_11 [Candidatus Saganbacteria bacterium]
MEKNNTPKVYIDKIIDPPELISKAFEFIGADKQIKAGDLTLLKPNLTYPKFKPGVTTTPQVLEATIKLLKDFGAKIIVGESDGGYNSYEVKDAYHDYGLYDLEKKYGIKVVNFSQDKSSWRYLTIHKYFKDFKVEYPALLEDCDHFITLPVPKVHAMTGISLSYKNQWGCVPNTMRLRYHPVFNEAIFAINQIPKSKFTIIDGTYGLTRSGPMVGDVFDWGFLLVSNSFEAADLIVSKMMGMDLKKIKHYKKAYKKGLIPKIEKININQSYETFKSDKFYLKRDVWNYLALSAWIHPWINHFFYESFAADLLHKIMYTFRKKPISD